MNETQVSSTANATLLSGYTPIHTNNTHLHLYDPANNLGYGVGRLLRGAFDHISRTWQGFWHTSISPEEKAHQMQTMIYKKGLEECVIHLERAIANLCKNPNDPHSMERLKKVAAHYQNYVNPAPTEELGSYQQNVFQSIETKIEKFANPRLKETLMEFLPFLSLKSIRALKKSELVEELNTELVASKSKRAVLEAFPASFDLNSLDGNNGFTVLGVAADGYLGQSVNTAGDINGDGIADLLLGANGVKANAGVSYVIFGSRNGFPASFNLTNLNGTNGFAIAGIFSEGQLGASISTVGDMNGDGISDLVLGARYTNSTAGASYVIFGSHSDFPASFNLTTLNGTNGFAIPGVAAGGNLGTSVSIAGDINGDNLSDLMLGAPNVNSNAGASYVIFGSRGEFPASFNLTTLNGTNGFVIPGITTGFGGALGGYLGRSVSTAGDINGDNLTDIALGAFGLNSYEGVSYIIFGSRNAFSASFNLTILNGTNGFAIAGIAGNGHFGDPVSTAGDINGDGIEDVVLGAWLANSNGVSYVIYGSRSGFPAAFNLAALNGTNGFAIPGVAKQGRLGSSTAGDINGDNISDLVLGASGANLGAGASYVIFGSRSEFPASFNLSALNGTNGFTMPGVASNGYLGQAVSTAGDINGDNISDLVLGAYNASSGLGASYVIFGQNLSAVSPTPTPTPIGITPTPSFVPTPTPLSTPPIVSPFTFCPSSQPLTLNNNDIQINKGQNLRLTPNDLSASCKNAATPNLGTNFTITDIEHAQFKTRNSSGFWNNASNFLGSDLSQANVELIQDNSIYAPNINFTVTDGQTTLSAAANVQFSTSESRVQVISIVLNIPSNGIIILSPQQFQINATGIKLDDVVISVVSTQDGYFTTINTPLTPIFDFTYYQLQNGQIEFVYNGTVLPNITFSIDDGSGLPVLVSPIVNLFETQTQNSEAVPKDIVIGSVVGAFALIAAGGLTAFGMFKYKEKRDHMVQQFGKAQAQDYRTHPLKTTNSY